MSTGSPTIGEIEGGGHKKPLDGGLGKSIEKVGQFQILLHQLIVIRLALLNKEPQLFINPLLLREDTHGFDKIRIGPVYSLRIFLKLFASF